MAQIIDGKKISTQIKDEVKEQVAALKQKGIDVTLAVIQVGKAPAHWSLPAVHMPKNEYPHIRRPSFCCRHIQ